MSKIFLLLGIMILSLTSLRFTFELVDKGMAVVMLIFEDLAAEFEGENHREKTHEESKNTHLQIAVDHMSETLHQIMRISLYSHYRYANPVMEVGSPPPEQLC